MGNAMKRGQLLQWLHSIGDGVVSDDTLGECLDGLKAIPSDVSIAGAKVRISTHLWRDFMPTCPPDGRPLIAAVTVTTDPPSPLPPAIQAVRLVLVYGSTLWITRVIEEHHWMRNDSRFEVIAREGPKWGPDVLVDAVLELRAGDGHSYLVRAGEQLIRRTS
ncbi:hypothetical protein [Cryptosporangium aurantiacum]|uniref:Uncharacterized protein n=1 Tax=Cryptosporangium aurantiacum TaxID=134849 RepID=A0A1M7RLP6_9ACTN|nr:hypothetical protein [Cryptosporangium aurantiacum]SHN47046.1 hypothetical protein SAMN05443668_1202 [Cryptosporangium aurantiacum]